MTAALALLQQLSTNPAVISMLVAALGWLWHKGTTAATSNSAALANAMAAVRSAFASIVKVADPGSTPETLAGQLYQVATAQRSKIGIDTASMSPLAAAMINAAIHDALDTFVQAHASPSTIASSVRAVSLSPPATAAK